MLFNVKKICSICAVTACCAFAVNENVLAVEKNALTDAGETVFEKKGFAPCSDSAVVSEIRYEGLLNTKPHVVDRELGHKEGEAYSSEKFEAEKSRLLDLDLFTDVSVSCEQTPQTSSNGIASVVLRYEFREIFRWIPAPASKKTDRDGLMVGLALANLNIAGEDIRAEMQYRTTVSPLLENNEYAFYMSSPYLFGLPLGWNLEFLRTDSWDNLRRFNDDSWLFDLDLDWRLDPHLAILLMGAYRYLNGGPGHLPEYGVGFYVDYRDAATDTRNGFYLEYDLTHVGTWDDFDGTSTSLHGENYWEVLADARAFVSFGSFVTGATALLRYRPGEVGFYDYFYHGGANTFRGLEKADSLHLGVHEMLLTLEERFVLLERRAASVLGINFFYGVQLVVGLDGNFLWDEGAPGWDDYEGAVYGGVHLVVPALDRIRFEVGYSPDKGEPQFHFGFFDKALSSRWRSR